jgi:linoleate 10R-lipoxygenase
VEDFLGGIRQWLSRQPDDPRRWTFGDLKRQGDGSFRDSDLVELLQLASENVAGSYDPYLAPLVKGIRA